MGAFEPSKEAPAPREIQLDAASRPVLPEPQGRQCVSGGDEPPPAGVPEEKDANQEQKLRGIIQKLSYALYALGHDLKEPIRTVRCHIGILRESTVVRQDANLYESSHFIDGAALRMENLLKGMLEYCRLVSEDPNPISNADMVDMNVVVQSALANLQLAIEESGAMIAYDTLPPVRGNAVQLTLLVQNLVGNSLKYRGEAPPRILIRAERSGSDVLFSFEDNGIGIDAAYHESIFTPFKRLHGSDVPGAGLGLAICRQITDLHRGRIWLKPNPASGSTFLFALPAAAM